MRRFSSTRFSPLHTSSPFSYPLTPSPPDLLAQPACSAHHGFPILLVGGLWVIRVAFVQRWPPACPAVGGGGGPSWGCHGMHLHDSDVVGFPRAFNGCWESEGQPWDCAWVGCGRRGLFCCRFRFYCTTKRSLLARLNSIPTQSTGVQHCKAYSLKRGVGWIGYGRGSVFRVLTGFEDEEGHLANGNSGFSFIQRPGHCGASSEQA